MNIINQVRAYHFLSGVLANQQDDLYCGRCSAWNNSLTSIRETLSRFETEHAIELRGLPPETSALLSEAKARLAGLALDPEPTGQKKAGNCKLPEGVCFVKASKALIEKV